MALAAVRYDLTTHVGDTDMIEITVQDAGVNVVLTGATATYRLSRGAGGAALVVATPSIGGSKVTVTIAQGLTDALAPGLYWHEVRLTEASTRETVLMKGRVVIQPRAAAPVP